MHVLTDFKTAETKNPLSSDEKTYLHKQFESVAKHDRIDDNKEFVYTLVSQLYAFGVYPSIRRKWKLM